jgi:mono/diheme cytochrome c family protein
VAPGAPDRQGTGIAVLTVLAVLLSGCAPPAAPDPDAAPDGPWPVAVAPESGATGVPTDPVIRIRFSDHLDERTVTAGRLGLTSGTLSYWLMSYYDPIRGELVVWPSSRLRRYATWVFRIEEGLAGLDGGEVAAGEVTTFRTGGEAGDDQPFAVLDYPEHVRPIFDAACAACHGGPGAPIAGLALDDAGGVAETLLGAPADGWPGWKRAAPGRPGESYLLYKLIGDERIAGSRMPRSFDGDGSAPPLPLADQVMISDWLAGGASFFDPAGEPD